MGVGSVGISPAPILQTACSTSGNFDIRILFAFSTTSTEWVKEPP